MEAGRELDALVAEKVMGFSDGPHTLYCWHDRKKRERPLHGAYHEKPGTGWKSPDYTAYVNEAGEKLFCGKPKAVFWPEHYSTQIGDAWEVVEKDDGWGFDWRLKRWAASSKPWTCTADRITDSRRFYVEAVTAPLAICLVALRAVE